MLPLAKNLAFLQVERDCDSRKCIRLLRNQLLETARQVSMEQAWGLTQREEGFPSCLL